MAFHIFSLLTLARDNTMRELFEPRSVVLVGVSRQTGVGAYNGLEMLLRYGYQGRIYVVHPKAEGDPGPEGISPSPGFTGGSGIGSYCRRQRSGPGGGGGMFCQGNPLADNYYPGICRRRHPGEKIAGKISGRRPSTPGTHYRSQHHGRIECLYLFFHCLRRSCLSR